MPRKRRQYSGKLAKPIVWVAPPTFEGFVSEKRVKEFWKKYNRHQRKMKDRVDKQIAEKLSLLMDFYGIANKNDMGALALALAQGPRVVAIIGQLKPAGMAKGTAERMP